MNQTPKSFRLMNHSKGQKIGQKKQFFLPQPQNSLPTNLQSTIVVCPMCSKKLTAIAYVITEGLTMCVGCFARSQKNSQGYQVVNYSKKRRGVPISLEKEIKVLQTIEKYGVDNLQLLHEDLSDEVTKQQLAQYIQYLNKQDRASMINSFKPVEKKKQETEKDSDMKKQFELFLSQTLQEKDYKISDYLLAYLNEKSDHETVNFLTLCKEKENSQATQINEKLCALYCKSQKCSESRQLQKKQQKRGQVKAMSIINRLESKINRKFDALKCSMSQKTESICLENFKDMMFSIEIPLLPWKQDRQQKTKPINKIQNNRRRIK